MRTLSFKAHANSEFGLLRGSVYSLHTSVYLPSCFIEGLVTQYWPLPTSAKKPDSFDTSAMILLPTWLELISD